MDFAQVISSISLTNPSWDLFVLVAFLVGIYFYMFRWGKDKAFMVLVCSYVSLALVDRLSLLKAVTGVVLEENYANKTALFLSCILLCFWMFSKSDFASVFTRGLKGARFQILVISFLQVGLIISSVVSFLPVAQADGLSIFLKTFFVDNTAQSFWLVAPFFAIYFIKEK